MHSCSLPIWKRQTRMRIKSSAPGFVSGLQSMTSVYFCKQLFRQLAQDSRVHLQAQQQLFFRDELGLAMPRGHRRSAPAALPAPPWMVMLTCGGVWVFRNGCNASQSIPPCTRTTQCACSAAPCLSRIAFITYRVFYRSVRKFPIRIIMYTACLPRHAAMGDPASVRG